MARCLNYRHSNKLSVDRHTTFNIDLGDLDSSRLGSTNLRFPYGCKREATALGKIGSNAYQFLHETFRIAPPFELVVLSEAAWKEAFGSQPYGDPVTPGDGRIYYGTRVPESWKEVTDRLPAISQGPPSSTLTPQLFSRTLAHEVGHLFSNELMGPAMRERMDKDFSSGNLEVLWFVEAFSQCCQFAYLDVTRDYYRLQWLRLYHRIFDTFRPQVRYRRLTDWGTHVVHLFRTDPENARLDYMWMQAKSYLMCEEANQGVAPLPGLARTVRRMTYPIASSALLKILATQASGFHDAFDRWNTA